MIPVMTPMERVAVVVDAPLHSNYLNITNTPGDKFSSMTGNCRLREIRDLFVGNRNFVLHCVHNLPQSAA